MKKILKGLILGAIVLFIVPFTVNAEESLQSLIDNGGVITLTKSYTEAIEIAEGNEVTIDLNGHKITVSGKGVDAIRNKGTLTIKGTGEITAEGAAIVNYPGALVTLDNGTYFSTGWYTIKNMGTMTINNMHFSNNVNNGSSLIANGFYGSLGTDRNQVYSGKEVKLTINGGTFENKNNSCNVIKNDDYGTLMINGGTFVANSDDKSNGNPVIQNWHIATINGGTFTSNNGVAIANGYLSDAADAGKLTINGGIFTGTKGLFGTNGGAKIGYGILTIEDGTFTGDATLSTAYKTVIKGGVFTDENVTPATESGYNAYNVIGEDKTIIAKESELIESVSSSALKESDIDAATLDLIKKTVKSDQKLAAIYNIDLFKTVDGMKVSQVTEANAKVLVTLVLPTDLDKVSDGYTRVYYIIRVHDNKTDVLDVTDNGDGTISFETDKFSTYALAYKDIENANQNVENPKTLDTATIYIGLFTVSLVAFYFSYRYVKKKLSN